MVWGVFGQTLQYNFVNYDDGLYVYENRMISKGVTLEGVRQAITRPHGDNWHPLTSFSHMLDVQLYGLNSGGHHRTNVLLHLATVILLFLVLRQTTGSLWRSAFVAAVFAIHPLRAESVAWISERKDVLSGLFFMLTLGAYFRYVRHPFSVSRYAAVAVFFTLGLMSKPMLVTLPFVLLLLDFWPLSRFQTLEPKKTIVRLVLEKIPLLLLTAVFCGITVWTQQHTIDAAKNLSAPWRFGNAFCSYATYIKQMVFPARLVPFYPHPGTGLPLWEIGASVALLAGISWGVFAGRKKHPYLITGWLWYLGMLVPVIGIMQVGAQAHADRYTYLPQIGLAIMAVWLAADWCASLRYRREVLSTAATVVLAVLTIAAHKQTRYWHDSFSLWSHTLACNDGNYLAHKNLGLAFYKRGSLDEAIRHYKRSIEINPNVAATYSSLGSALYEQGKTDMAVKNYEKALEINPEYLEAHTNLGNIFSRQGQFDKAILHLEKALQINPSLAQAHNSLGIVFSKQEKFDKAVSHFEKALEINPDLAEAHANLGSLFSRQGLVDKATPHFEKFLEINPGNAKGHCNLGNLFLSKKNFRAALQQYDQAVRINPDYAEAQNNLAWILATCPDAALRDGQRAVKLARSADRLSGGNRAHTLNTLAAAYAEAGQYPEAVTTARRALNAAAGQEPVSEGLRARLRLYETGVPYHEPEGAL